MPFSTSFKKPGSGDPKAAALEAARAKAAIKTGSEAAITRWIPPAEAKERLRLIFDDSGSMAGDPIEDARAGTIELLRNCIPNQTAVAVHFLRTESELSTMSTDLIHIAAILKELPFTMGGTPLFKIALDALAAEPALTRMVLFTDGSPTDSLVPWERTAESKHPQNRYLDSADVLITAAKEKRAPIDTVYFGSSEEYTRSERELLDYIAKETGGFYMIFDPKKVNFRTAFKYLAPVNRLMLASESVRREIESGKRS